MKKAAAQGGMKNSRSAVDKCCGQAPDLKELSGMKNSRSAFLLKTMCYNTYAQKNGMKNSRRRDEELPQGGMKNSRFFEEKNA